MAYREVELYSTARDSGILCLLHGYMERRWPTMLVPCQLRRQYGHA